MARKPVYDERDKAKIFIAVSQSEHRRLRIAAAKCGKSVGELAKYLCQSHLSNPRKLTGGSEKLRKKEVSHLAFRMPMEAKIAIMCEAVNAKIFFGTYLRTVLSTQLDIQESK